MTSLRERLADRAGCDLTFWDGEGFDLCIVGLAWRFGFSQPVVAYDREAMVRALVLDLGDEESAEEWMGYNIEGAWVGDGTPVFVSQLEEVSSD